MYSVGYVTFDNVDCVYTIDNTGIRLIPTQEENIRKLNADYRWNRTDYTPQILTSLFAAFESEYKNKHCLLFEYTI